MDVTQALQEVLRIANHRRGLAKGLHEVAKVLGEYVYALHAGVNLFEEILLLWFIKAKTFKLQSAMIVYKFIRLNTWRKRNSSLRYQGAVLVSVLASVLSLNFNYSGFF